MKFETLSIVSFTNNILYELGHLNSRTPQPNGWPDLAVDWLTPEMMDRRVRYIVQISDKLGIIKDNDTKTRIVVYNSKGLFYLI